MKKEKLEKLVQAVEEEVGTSVGMNVGSLHMFVQARQKVTCTVHELMQAIALANVDFMIGPSGQLEASLTSHGQAQQNLARDILPLVNQEHCGDFAKMKETFRLGGLAVVEEDEDGGIRLVAVVDPGAIVLPEKGQELIGPRIYESAQLFGGGGGNG